MFDLHTPSLNFAQVNCVAPDPEAANRVQEFLGMIAAIKPELEKAESALQTVTSNLEEAKGTILDLIVLESGLQEDTNQFIKQAVHELASTGSACDRRSLASQIRARKDELSLVQTALTEYETSYVPDILDQQQVVRIKVLEFEALRADVDVLLDEAQTSAAVYGTAVNQGALYVLGARTELLKADASRARRFLKQGQDLLSEMRAARAKRDTARKAVGTITTTNLTNAISRF